MAGIKHGVTFWITKDILKHTKLFHGFRETYKDDVTKLLDQQKLLQLRLHDMYSISSTSSLFRKVYYEENNFTSTGNSEGPF